MNYMSASWLRYVRNIRLSGIGANVEKQVSKYKRNCGVVLIIMNQILIIPLRQEQKNRIGFFDLAKGFCILLVVVFHITVYYEIENPASNLLKFLRLPLYFFLSGCFFKTYNGFCDFLLRKTNKLLKPFIFWFLLASMVLPLLLARCGIVLFPDYLSIKDILIGFVYGKFPNSVIWFLLCLFWVNIMFYFITIIARKFKNPLAVIIALSASAGLIGVTLGALHIRIPFFIDSAFTSLPFFIFGYLMYRHSHIAETNKCDKWVPLILIVLIVLLYFLSPFYSLKYNQRVNYQSFLPIYLCGFAGALCVVLLSKWIKRLTIFNYWGRYSIMILVSHSMVFRLVGYELGFSGLNAIWCCVVNIVVTMGICSLLIPFFIRFMPYVTAQKDILSIGEKETV